MSKNALSHPEFPCPICGVLIGPWARGITYHARQHGLSTAELWLKQHGLQRAPTCACQPGCQQPCTFYSWALGYNQYSRGHFDVQTRGQNTTKQLTANHWARGKTKETDERLLRAGAKTSTTLKAGFASGDIKIWSKCQTKETHPSIMSQARALRGSKHHFYEAEHVARLIVDRLDDRLTLMTNIDAVAQRTNNRELRVDIVCTRCGLAIVTTVYNVIRKTKQRCPSCDPIKRWTSAGETALAEELERLYGAVQRFVWVNGWSIDVHVPSIDAYFQFDGVYWHGLDRPLEQNTNAKIVQKYHRDQVQVAWFLSAGLNLVRITEVEWEEAADKGKLIADKVKASNR